jgi:hypothetical protein
LKRVPEQLGPTAIGLKLPPTYWRFGPVITEKLNWIAASVLMYVPVTVAVTFVELTGAVRMTLA